MAHAENSYYIPHGSHWPIVGSIGVFTLFIGLANMLNGVSWGTPVLIVGFAITIFIGAPILAS